MSERTFFHVVCGMVFGGNPSGRGGLNVGVVRVAYVDANGGPVGFGSSDPSVISFRVLFIMWDVFGWME